MKMNMGSGFKKFLGAMGVILLIGVIGNITSPKTAVKGSSAVVEPTIVITATPTTVQPTVTNTPIPTATITPIPTIAHTPTPTRKYIAPTATAQPVQTNSAGSSASTGSNDTYVNSQGNTVQSPVQADIAPAGASAKCGDGTYSFSQSRRGTCSSHGGVAQWL